ncbi:cytochrome c family protein [Rhodoblastus acidophilus]|uniref:Cytochrome c family protein n=1 Tax=Candidatus Rhodoblastus alkanivorans TaxID=2954117 RepID=A0ABS9Z2G8_9HYPH|nr:cytochrome c family protein [Candidatus Rhodoblastus alkanivorans]MCI4677510.1 cytochrome c family protein [Candidatus Rhodoblastus alkanivorans]MCI4681869.1 cytochrome c family protein [Candidatus Rhodoblastus alkanivorans]MDI4642919.1 cytochrome c family protein [Rhodoblastus acidophilus]
MLLLDYRVYGALFGSILFALFLGVFSDALVVSSPANPPGFDLPSSAGPVKKAAAPVATPLPVLLAKADPKKGEALAKVCATCHNFKEGAGAKVGPDLWGVVGRPKGSVAGFGYSDAMKKKGGDWTFADINEFITNPKAFVPGTKMGFGGEANPEKRADIIAFLRTLSEKPVPLPPTK